MRGPSGRREKTPLVLSISGLNFSQFAKKGGTWPFFSYPPQMLKLQAAIKYGEEDLAGAKSLVDQCPPDDTDTEINRGIIGSESVHTVYYI